MEHACSMASQQLRPLRSFLPFSRDIVTFHNTLHILREASMRRCKHQTMAAGPSGKQQMLVGSSGSARPVVKLICDIERRFHAFTRIGVYRQRRDLPQVYVPSHPLVKHWLAVARNKLSPPPVFRGAIAELGRLLIYEASAEEGWLPVLEGQAETPCGIADVAFLDPGRPVKACTCLPKPLNYNTPMIGRTRTVW